MLQCHAPPPAHPFIIYIFKQHKPHLHKYRIRGSVSNEPTVTKVYSSATYPAPHKNAGQGASYTARLHHLSMSTK